MNATNHQEAVLMLCGAEAAAKIASEVAKRLDCHVDLVDSRRMALQAVRRRHYSLLLLDDGLVEADADQTATLLGEAGPAYPLQLNFAISNLERVLREVRAALSRRNREIHVAHAAAASALEAEMRSALTGILLELDLVMATPRPGQDVSHLERIAKLTKELRAKLGSAELPLPAGVAAWSAPAVQANPSVPTGVHS